MFPTSSVNSTAVRGVSRGRGVSTDRVIRQRAGGRWLGRLDVGSTRESMRIRTLISILLTVGWLLPAGAFACPPRSAEADPHSDSAHHGHSAHHDGHEQSHAASDRGDFAHDHAASSEPARDEPGAPADAPTCCRDDSSALAVVVSVLDAKPCPKSISLALSPSVPEVQQSVALPSRAWLRLRQPAPLPYARTRRPLLI
jgi:hypothetical protein